MPGGIAAPTTTSVTVASDDDEADTPDIDGVEGGSLAALVGGEAAEVSVTESNGSLVAEVAGVSVTYTVIGSDGLARPLRRGSVISLGLGDRVRVDFAGFADMTSGRAWIAPDDVSLGKTTLVGGRGRIETPVPETDRQGERRLVASADTATGESIVVAYGVEFDGPKTTGPSWSLVFLVILGLAAVGALIVPAARRRRAEED